MMYLSSSGLRSNYEGESRIHVSALAKPLVSPGCLPHFPTNCISGYIRVGLGLGLTLLTFTSKGHKERIYAGGRGPLM